MEFTRACDRNKKKIRGLCEKKILYTKKKMITKFFTYVIVDLILTFPSKQKNFCSKIDKLTQKFKNHWNFFDLV